MVVTPTLVIPTIPTTSRIHLTIFKTIRYGGNPIFPTFVLLGRPQKLAIANAECLNG